jgi:hypothetical protein
VKREALGVTAAPWPVVAVRLGGLPRVRPARRCGRLRVVVLRRQPDRPVPATAGPESASYGGLFATVLGLLVQGPYTSGLPMSQMFDPLLVRDTMATRSARP